MLTRIPVRCAIGIGSILGLCISLILASMVVLFIPSHPVLPKGWTLQKQCSGANCWSIGATPDTGVWLGFRIGMSHREALRALCDAVLSKQVYDASDVIELRDGGCIIDRKSLDPSWDIWGLK